MADLTPFNPQNWPINVQVIWEPWFTPDCAKILTLLVSRKGKPIFSCRGLSTILSSNKDSISKALKKLIEFNYLIKEGPVYYINSSIEALDKCSELETPVAEPIRKCSESETVSVSNQLHNNNKLITVKNDEDPTSPDAPIKRSPNVILSDSQMERLAKKFGGLEEVDYWVHRLTAWQLDNPKKQKKDHARTIYNWRADKIAEGYKFYNHPETGWNYYKPWVIEKLKEAQQ